MYVYYILSDVSLLIAYITPDNLTRVATSLIMKSVSSLILSNSYNPGHKWS